MAKIAKKKTQVEKLQQTPVEAYTHEHSKRANIPTQELSHLAEKKIEKKVYAYDPSLDPQLIWTGKEENKQLEVDTTPVYIHEFISPKGIIDKLRNPDGGFEIRDYGLFHDSFKDEYQKDFAKQVEYYQHDNKWTNRMILGDSLLAMNSLLEKEGMNGKVQCVYIDPPYGIKFGSNWQVSTNKKEVKDGKDDEITRDMEQIKAFRDTWELGIHSYLTYLRERLITSRELLTQSGSCFVQISDENVHLIRNLMDEVFGSENFVSQITMKRASVMFTKKYLKSNVFYLIRFAKDINNLKYRQSFVEQDIQDFATSSGSHMWFEDTISGESIKATPEQRQDIKEFLSKNIHLVPFATLGLNAQGTEKQEGFVYNGKTYYPPHGTQWKSSYKGLQRLSEINRIIVEGNNIRYKYYHKDYPVTELGNYWESIGAAGEKIYVVQTNEEIVQRCILMTTDPGDTVIDPTCGSGTTATVCEQRGRRWITMDTSRVALALARTRLMTTIYPYYKLKDNTDIRAGFFYKSVPHITLKSLANDETSEEEVLYDQPLSDNKVIRVSGPFTVEGLAPHRIDDQGEVKTTQDFVFKVVENLRKYGIQTGIKSERLMFETLDVLSSPILQASGEYLENGKTKKAGILIGPEYGSIDDDMINDAIKQTSKHIDLLVVAGVSFTGSAFTTSDTAFDNPNFKCIKVKINPDLAMDDLLKKTSSGNIFMTFGEPDISIKDLGNSLIQLTVNGVDVYDATTGQLRKGTDNEIACWFIDADYDETSFFVTHAYFTGGDKPLEKLAKALKAEINQEAREQIYTTTSAPISKPKKGKIAVKVINHFGDEVMKIIEVK